MNFPVDQGNFLRFAGGGAVRTATSGTIWQALSRLNKALAADEVDSRAKEQVRELK